MKNKVGIIVVSIVAVAALVVSGIVFTPMIVRSSREKAYTGFVEANDYSSAAAIVEKMLLKDDSKENKERLAKAYFILERYDEAAPLYKELLELDTQNVEYLSDYSKVLVEIKNYAEAITIYESLKNATGGNETYTALSYLYEEMGDHANALLNIEYLLGKEPNDALLNFKAGLLNKELSDMDSALRHLEKATMLDLQNEEYAIVYASSLHDEGQTHAAIEFLRECEAKSEGNDLDSIFASYSMEYVNAMLGNKEYIKAIDYLRNSEARYEGNELDALYEELIIPPSSPTFSLDGGTYELDVPVTLELTHGESKVSIYYTLDGKRPDVKSILYTGPFIVLEPGGSVVDVIAVALNEKGIYSTIESRTYEYPVDMKDAALAEIIAEYLGTTTQGITYAMLDGIRKIEIWGEYYGINTDYNNVIKGYGSDGGFFKPDGRINTTVGKVKSLEDISMFRNLEILSVNGCRINALPDFSALPRLWNVMLMDDGLSDLSKLSTMTNVTQLFLAGNNISNIKPITANGKLDRIWLGFNNISSLPDMSGMRSVLELRLERNNLSGIQNISGLVSVKNLSLGINNIVDIAPLANLTNLQYLSILQNNITDISALSGLTEMKELFISNNKITNVSALTGMKNLTFLNASGNKISDISPFLQLKSLDVLYFKYNGTSYNSSILDQMSWVKTKEIN